MNTYDSGVLSSASREDYELLSANKGSGSSLPDPNQILSCFIINMRTGKVITFPAYPRDFTEGYSTNFEPFDARGRSAGYYAYNNNGPRSLGYSVTLQDDLCDVMKVVDNLRSLVYPEYVGSYVKPPYCYLHIGSIVDCYAIMDNIDFSWGGDDAPVLDGSDHYSKVDVTFSFTELRIKSLPTVRGVFNEGM